MPAARFCSLVYGLLATGDPGAREDLDEALDDATRPMGARQARVVEDLVAAFGPSVVGQ